MKCQLLETQKLVFSIKVILFSLLMPLWGIGIAIGQIASPDELKFFPAAETVLEQVTRQWARTEAIRMSAQLEMTMRVKDFDRVEKLDISIRAQKPQYIVLKALGEGSLNVELYNGEFVYSHTAGNRFARAPLDGDLQTFQTAGKMASYPLVLADLFIADSSNAYLQRFEEAYIVPSASPDVVRLILKRGRETIIWDLKQDGEALFPLEALHVWTFEPDVYKNTGHYFQLFARERYDRFDSSSSISLEEFTLNYVGDEVIRMLTGEAPDPEIKNDDRETSPGAKKKTAQDAD